MADAGTDTDAALAEFPAPTRREGELPQLKRLLIAGFKSFATPVEFEFLPGITGIVGPNGCGKSNVVDAVRWVLGEQSPRSLRGNEMQDVIFNGAQGEAALGYAEVTITFANCRGSLSPEFDEVAVGRRLYRSGESEYFLNQQSCRLKDVREVFMGTGAGMEAYSIVEQGKVDALLTSNTQDRRAVFDEVAGISKYRVRVRQAQSKLERVTQELARVEDVVKEVDGRLGQIRRQARKAELYRAKTQRLATVRLAVNRHRHAGFMKELGEIDGKLQESGRRVAEASAERERLEADRAKAEAELARFDARRLGLHGEILATEGKLNLLERERYLGEVRRGELEKDSRDQEARAENASLRSAALKEEVERAGAALASVREALKTAGDKAAGTGKLLEEAQSRLAAHRARADELEQARTSALRRLEEARARLAVLEERRQGLQRQLGEGQEISAHAEKALRTAQGRLASAQAARDGTLAVLRQLERDAAEAEKAQASARDVEGRAREGLAALEARAAALTEAEKALETEGETRIQAIAQDDRVLVADTWKAALGVLARLARKADEMRAAGVDVKRLEEAAQAAARTLASQRAALAQARAESEKASAAQAEAQRGAGEAEIRARMAGERLRALQVELEVLASSASESSRELQRLSAPGAEQALAFPPGAVEAVPGAPSAEELAAALDRARQEDAAARVAQAHLEGELSRAEAALREAEGARERSASEGAEAARAARAAREGAAAIAGEDAQRQASRRDLEAQAAKGREAMAALEAESQEASSRQRGAAQSLREMGEVVRRLTENHQGFVVRRSEVEAKRLSLLEQCRENFGWAEAEVAQPPEEPLDPAAPEGGLGPLLQEAEALDEQIRRMGLVNLEALEEEGALETRLKGLTDSRDDLTSASASLQELIKELDARSETQFLQVFEEVKQNFQELFRRLFGGGRADVLLEDPTRVLDSGIEIIARPPGREPLPISLLSGGQKALAAVALIFAFFRSRPSPFYILDEVDAPLDESNIDRFLGLLQEFAKVSQFLIITHNRRTMRMAGTLYGVTMQRPGVSTRMGVRFEDLHPTA